MSNKRTPSALPLQFREARIAATPKEGERLSGPDPGRFEFVVSSEEPVRRWFGDEILLHSKENVRTGRLDAGMVPGLFNHDMDKQLGIVDKYELKDGKLRVSGPFGPSPFAQEKRADYDAGILKAASVGYRVYKMVRTVTEDGEGDEDPENPPRCEVRDWEPYDASLVTVPADYAGSGVGRSDKADKEYPVELETVTATRSADSAAAPTAEVISEPPSTQEKRNMADTANTPSPAELELKRVQDILAVAGDEDFGKHVSQDEVRKAITDKTTADAFKDTVIRKIIDANDAAKVGTMGDRTFESAGRDGRRYSFTNVLRSIINRAQPGSFRSVPDTTFEREMSDELGKRLNINTTGFLVPLDALTRALGTQAIAGASGQLAITSEAAAVASITRPEVIELLRNRPRVQALGARVLGGLQGIVRLPRQSAAGTWQWLGEGANTTPSDLSMDFVSVQPRRGSTQSAVDIELLASTSPDVEGLMRADFNRIRGLGIDLASLVGPVGGPGPVGLMNATGLALIPPSGTTMASGGKALSYQDYIAFETATSAANADAATSGWMLTPETRGLAKGTQKFPGANAEPIWKEGPKDPSGLEDGPLGYRAGVTNQLPKNGTASGVTGAVLHTGIFGDWSQLILADWGVVEVVYDPYTQAGAGAIVLTMRSLHDTAVRHIAAFAASNKIAVA